jgi:hypothetical protein
MSTPNGNLPSNNNVSATVDYFNNFFTAEFTVTQNVDDAVIAYFESITGNKETAKVLASTVIYTALSQGIEPMSVIEELRNLQLKNQSNEQKYLVVNKDGTGNKQTVFAATPTDAIIKAGEQIGLTPQNSIIQLTATLSYGSSQAVDQYAKPGPKKQADLSELDAYLTMLLNLNRVSTSLLGISNQPQTNKYVQRAILP